MFVGGGLEGGGDFNLSLKCINFVITIAEKHENLHHPNWQLQRLKAE